jgi:hypothetical protein
MAASVVVCILAAIVALVAVAGHPRAPKPSG